MIQVKLAWQSKSQELKNHARFLVYITFPNSYIPFGNRTTMK